MNLLSGKKKTGLLFLVLAIISGILVAGLILMLGSKMTPSTPVLVANTEITPGDPLSREMFKEVKLPPAGIPEKTVKPTIDLSNAIAAYGMSSGDILRATHIINLEDLDPPILSARLRALDDASLRAVEVPAETVDGMLGGMKAGDKVDIISVTQSEETEDLVSKTIIKTAQVVGVRPPTEGRGSLVVALTQEQVEVFSLAREKGKIYASLLPFGISDTVVLSDTEEKPIDSEDTPETEEDI